MRGILLCILVIFAPFASSLPAPPNFDDAVGFEIWHESVIIAQNGVWDYGMWQEVIDAGGHPLRTLDEKRLVAWRTDNFELDRGWLVIESAPAEWKSDLLLDSQDFDQIKILFEPRLPDHAYSQIKFGLQQSGIRVEGMDLWQYNPMPQKLITDKPESLDLVLQLPGVLWVEPVLSTNARNLAASAYLSDGNIATQPHWEFGLNGDGVVLGVADSGLDIDHSCFRNGSASVGPVGEEHRKVLVNNISLNDGDNPGEMDYRHGTHVAGSLVCHDVYNYLSEEKPQNASTISYGAKLVFQDIVSQDGWIPPDNVTELLIEHSLAGGIIHSNSWGDDTTAYTDRTADFDLWALENPWSLSFIAPGNTGGQLLEPSNGRNVIAIGASTKSSNPEIWQSSSVGPTELGTYGIFAVAPGVSISSAKADGIDDSMNDALRASSGTSMATPVAASYAGIIQQMVEQGWIMSANEPVNIYNLSDIKPPWSTLPDESLGLGDGFTPSGSLIRSLMAIGTRDINVENAYFNRNHESGWGVLSLNELIDFETLEQSLGQENLTPSENLWIHDSYRSSFNTVEWLTNRFQSSPSGDITESPWNGQGAAGPFLTTGESWSKRLVPNHNEDFEIVLSFPARPEPFGVDDLRLMVNLSNGYTAVGEVYDPDGFSSLYTTDNFVLSQFEQSNETSMGIKISSSDLVGVEWLDVVVQANYISPGNNQAAVGVDGNYVGFALAAKGVVRDSVNWEDSDGDGLPNAIDECPNQHTQSYDLDEDGCPDDIDGDGVIDEYDDCPTVNSQAFDDNLDGCIDDSDGDGIGDDVDICETEIIDPAYPVGITGCRPIDAPIIVTEGEITGLYEGVWTSTIVVTWQVSDEDLDPYLTGSRIMINQTNNNSFFPIATCTAQDVLIIGNIHQCIWDINSDLPIFDTTGYGMHVQFFAQSLNASPEAFNDIIYLDSETYFFTPVDNNLNPTDKRPASPSFSRSIGWGIITIFSVALVLSKLWSVTRENSHSASNEPFLQTSRTILNENE
ncbi:MAG: S8 family serine peptidase [Candidatus Thermoplasmatota archaeon]|nr:S8 family serine peptidase [Candidatus Thermoplasmatota archaeon]